MPHIRKIDPSSLTKEDEVLLTKFSERRAAFEGYIQLHRHDLCTCPGCGYPTLTERFGYEICPVCDWEDDGQDDEQEYEIWGGPNKDLSLVEQRISIGKRLQVIANDLGGEVNLNPDEVMDVIENYIEKLNSFDDYELLYAAEGDSILKAWNKEEENLKFELIKR